MSRRPLISPHRLLLALIAMLCLLPSCSLEDDASKFFSDEALENCLSFGTDGIFTLPVNLSPYDLNPRTKSSVKDTAYSINTDSLLDNLRRKHIRDNGEEMSQSSLYRLLEAVLKRYGITYSVVLVKSQKDGSLQFRWGSYSQDISKDEIKAAKNCFTQLTSNK